MSWITSHHKIMSSLLQNMPFRSRKFEPSFSKKFFFYKQGFGRVKSCHNVSKSCHDVALNSNFMVWRSQNHVTMLPIMPLCVGQ